MIPDRPTSSRSVSSPLVWLLLIFGTAMMLAVALGTWWAVGRIDDWAESQERQTIMAGLEQEKRRIEIEQDSTIVWDEAVLQLQADDQAWIADNLAEWMSQYFGHDRVYVIAADGHVVRAAAGGRYAGQAIDPLDQAALGELLAEFRARVARASVGHDESTLSLAGFGLLDTVTLGDGAVAYVSIRPIVPTSSAVNQLAGEEFLHVSVKRVSGAMLDQIGRRYGFTDLRVVSRNATSSTLPVVNNAGRVIAVVGWTPKHPVVNILLETAPVTLGVFGLGFAGLLALIAWLHRMTLRLEIAQDQTTYLALHDPLTGIANRALFETRLQQAMSYQYLAPTKVALVSIDLDGFKEVNDTLGHAAGDELIRQVAKRLAFALPEEATIARVGGDEFALVQPGMISQGQARWICEGLIRTFHDPFVLGGEIVEVTASLGVSLEDGREVPAAEMLRRADVALYAAKAEGRNRLAFYEPQMDASRREKRVLEVDLRNALVTEQGLFALYQPIFSARTGGIVGAEALVRWQHPERGLLSPDIFIAIAEETGLINQLGNWVLEQSCRAAVASDLPWIAVNISPVQLRHQDFASRVKDVLNTTGLPADRLELEITEGVLLQHAPLIETSLARLQQMGIRIALDDFGTGYSSISYLRTYKIDKLKIDQSFTRLMGHDEVTRTIVQSVIQMAEALGIAVTAEGVEEDSQRQTLAKLGCAQFQGYLFSRPVTAERLTELLVLQRSAA